MSDVSAPAGSASAGQVRSAPTGLSGVLRQLGPGLIITASIVGSGELIVTTKLGADVGFRLLWFIILGCMIKVFVQIELGRYAIAQGKTTLQALDSIPGPRLLVSWLVLVWIGMYICTFFQIAGMMSGIGSIFQFGGSALSKWLWVVLVALSCGVLLGIGHYRLVERTATMMVALFTLFTVLAVGGLYWTRFAIRWQDIQEGLRFQLRDPASSGIGETFTTAFAAFGIIGVGASELIYYPYWCLEKGYARHVGPKENTAEWYERARGWMRILRIDAWTSMVIYTGATIAFYLLGAAVLHGKGISVQNQEMIPSLSQLYSESFGLWGHWIFLIGAFMVLYSTVFIATASNGRLLADLSNLLGVIHIKTAKQRDGWSRLGCVMLTCVCFVIFCLFPEEPVTTVFVGALAQATMLPLLCGAALYFLHCQTDQALRPGKAWILLVWVSTVLMTSVGIYQLAQRLAQLGKG